MMAADKAAIRRELRKRRSAFVGRLGAGRGAANAAIAGHLTGRLSACHALAGYIAIGAEADPAAILQAAHRMGIATALPHVSTPDAPMRFLHWQPGDALHEGPFGLLQPSPAAETVEPDLILAPLLGFDRAGGRIGQGAGFYDRVFAANPLVLRVGIAWSVQEMPALPLDAWDVPLHAVATEREWIEITPGRAGESPSASSSSSR